MPTKRSPKNTQPINGSRAKKSAESTSLQAQKDPIDKFLNKIVCGDSVKTMRRLPDESIDLVVTSPPYNLKNSTGNGILPTAIK
jgi:predicted methyltransferase